jgi:chromosome segregation ATPase
MLYKEMSIHDFEPWSGAVNTYRRLERNNKLNDLEWSLSEIFGRDDIEETDLNDLLWFEPDTVYEMVGLETESEIEDRIEEIESEIEYVTECMDVLDEELEECEPGSNEWQSVMNSLVNHKVNMNDLYDELDRLREELEEF